MRGAASRLGPAEGEPGQDSPGPAYYEQAATSGTGKEGPAFTMGGKPREKEPQEVRWNNG